MASPNGFEALACFPVDNACAEYGLLDSVGDVAAELHVRVFFA